MSPLPRGLLCARASNIGGSDRDWFDRTACLARSSSPLSQISQVWASSAELAGLLAWVIVSAMVSLVFRSRFGMISRPRMYGVRQQRAALRSLQCRPQIAV
jgi:hypothetical protein